MIVYVALRYFYEDVEIIGVYAALDAAVQACCDAVDARNEGYGEPVNRDGVTGETLRTRLQKIALIRGEYTMPAQCTDAAFKRLIELYKAETEGTYGDYEIQGYELEVDRDRL